jgi:hypothetical protein
MQGCQLGPAGVDAFLEALARNRTLTSWDIYQAAVGSKGPERLAAALGNQPTLTRLVFSYVPVRSQAFVFHARRTTDPLPPRTPTCVP